MDVGLLTNRSPALVRGHQCRANEIERTRSGGLYARTRKTLMFIISSVTEIVSDVQDIPTQTKETD